MDYAAKFPLGLAYRDFLAQYGTDEQRRRWQAVHDAVVLTSPQRELLAGFKRRMEVVCLAGAWCGDCVNQCPIFDHLASASTALDVRYFDRDAHPDLSEALSICGGARVPVVVFLSEDGRQLGWYGDRTLAKYRQMAAEQAGAVCPSGLVVPDAPLLAAVTQDWLDEFERAQLILLTSPRLRKLHGD